MMNLKRTFNEHTVTIRKGRAALYAAWLFLLIFMLIPLIKTEYYDTESKDYPRACNLADVNSGYNYTDELSQIDEKCYTIDSESILYAVKDNSDEGTSWAWYNDGTYWYYDNESSNIDLNETVYATEGIDINIRDLKNITPDEDGAVTVAVVDTGIDIDHEELKDMLWKNELEIPDDGIDNDGNGYTDDVYGWNFYDDNSEIYNSGNYTEDAHGTHIAGIIHRTVKEVYAGVPNVKIMSVKSMGGINGTGKVSDIIKGIQYAEANGADICNLSLGFRNWNENLYNTIKDSNMLFVIAAGNGESDTNGTGFDLGHKKRYPACYELDNIIVVANMRCDGKLHYSSNYSDEYVDIAAPGTKILSTSTAKSGYEVMTGTSMSAPFVAAEAACISLFDPDMSVEDIKSCILDTKRSIPELEGKVRTGGMIDIGRAMKLLMGVEDTPTPTAEASVSPSSAPSPTPDTTSDPNATSTPKATNTPGATSSPTSEPSTNPTAEPTGTPDTTSDPNATGTPNATNTPGATSAPTLEPSSEPSLAPSPTPETTSDPNTTNTPNTTNPPAATSAPTSAPSSNPTQKKTIIKQGKIYVAGKGKTKAKYLVKNAKKRFVTYYRCLVPQKYHVAKIPGKIRLGDGKIYKVSGVAKKAFKKAKNIRKIKKYSALL